MWLTRGLVAGALVLLGGAVAYSVSGDSVPTSPLPPTAAPGDSTGSPAPVAPRPPTAMVPRAQAPADAGPAPLEPWQVAGERPAATPPPGYVPAWKVRPPRPEQTGQAPLPPPREPPEPSLHRPPGENPGGVNGTRPARPTPGLE